jgi:hypothetical protein
MQNGEDEAEPEDDDNIGQPEYQEAENVQEGEEDDGFESVVESAAGCDTTDHEQFPSLEGTAPSESKIELDLLSPGKPSRQSRRRQTEWERTTQHAIKQSERDDVPEELVETKQDIKFAAKARVAIDGSSLTIRDRTDDSDFTQPKLWDKTKRHLLEPDIKQIFVKNATSYTVLAKNNKLSVPVIKAKEDGTLARIHAVQGQLKTIKNHLNTYDIVDVFNLVIPKNVWKESTLKGETSYDLFENHAKLHPTIVANSCAWYNKWVAEDYIRENMQFSFLMIQMNTSESLFNKCLEDYEEYEPLQRGGPLILSLILRRIQDVSESAIDHLKHKVSNLKISEIPGEDVDVAVSLIKSTHTALLSASTPDHSYVPEDFPCTILGVFQTSSVPAFNGAFEHELMMARHKADKFGGRPKWPTVGQLTSLATNIYTRLNQNGEWVKPSGGKASAFQFIKPTGQTQPGRGDPQRSRPPFRCFNCGSEAHGLPDCDKPRNEDKIAANRARMAAATAGRGGSGRGRGRGGRGRGGRGSRPPYKSNPEGRPMVLNKKGAYVLDQKKVKKTQALETLVRALTNSTSAAPSAHVAAASDSSTAAETAETTSVTSQARAETIRGALATWCL